MNPFGDVNPSSSCASRALGVKRRENFPESDGAAQSSLVSQGERYGGGRHVDRTERGLFVVRRSLAWEFETGRGTKGYRRLQKVEM
jgi:hypothetical protein